MHKLREKLFYFILAVLGIVMSCCNKLEEFGSANVYPDGTSTPDPAALLTNALANLVWDPIEHQSQGILGAGRYCQYFSETYVTLFTLYIDNVTSPMWQYSGILKDLQILTDSDMDNHANENQRAVACILKAYIIWNISDCWGDVPYSEAFTESSNISYDPQETIYKDLINELKEANAQLTSDQPIPGDIAYDGEGEKWKKLSNSLRMLMALNLSKRYPGASEYASIEFNTALLDGVGCIESNEDNFQLRYPGGAAFRNPFYNLYLGGNYNGESATLVSILVDSLGNDLRQTAFGSDGTGNPSILGVPYGRDTEYVTSWQDQNPQWCYILAPEFRLDNSPHHIIKASSVLLARAEAADRGWTQEETESLYQAGISASFVQWGLAPPDPSYFEGQNVALGAPGENLKQIATQQYIAHYPDGIQGWNTWRRTGFPILYPAPDAINDPPVIPRRFMYGKMDYSLCNEGVEEAVSRMDGGDKMDSRIWWDKE